MKKALNLVEYIAYVLKKQLKCIFELFSDIFNFFDRNLRHLYFLSEKCVVFIIF